MKYLSIALFVLAACGSHTDTVHSISCESTAGAKDASDYMAVGLTEDQLYQANYVNAEVKDSAGASVSLNPRAFHEQDFRKGTLILNVEGKDLSITSHVEIDGATNDNGRYKGTLKTTEKADSVDVSCTVHSE